MKSFYVYTLGCKVNSYEIEAIKDDLLNAGLVLKDVNEADYIIINTCCVTNTAASKSRQKISSLHQKNPNAKIMVMGCYVQGFYDEIKDFPQVMLYVGTNKRSQIKDYILNDLNTKTSLVDDITNFKEYENLHITNCFEKTRAYLKIQDGCNNFCSYCIIPYVRGTIKSRLKEDVLKEVEHLISLGYKEIVLTGIHTGSYGKDFINYSFTDLVKDILKIDGLYRLRISSIEESEITDELILLMKENNKLAHHLHIPLQAGSDNVLKKMNRKYDVKTFIDKVLKIKKEIQDIAITTDVIVGFPLESDEDFKETIKTCKTIGFAKIHVFPFSSRKGTVASKMVGQINGSIKKQRANELLAISDELSLTYNNLFLNQVVEVLVEELSGQYYVGHTSNFIKVMIATDQKLVRNSLVLVKIIKCLANEVIAKIN